MIVIDAHNEPIVVCTQAAAAAFASLRPNAIEVNTSATDKYVQLLSSRHLVLPSKRHPSTKLTAGPP